MTTPEFILAACHLALLAPLCVLGLHKAWLIVLWLRRRQPAAPASDPTEGAAELPTVTVQLPLYNERFVAARLLRAVAALDYPHDRLEVQVLDDSTDDTPAIVADTMRELPASLRVLHVRRGDRTGYKAGALAHGLTTATGECIAIFDADFVPHPDFLQRTVPEFRDPQVGLVQARWGHTNRGHSTLTEVQALLLDGHFAVEQDARAGHGCFFNFNGTAGVFRRACIEAAGGWQHDTLTEDMDLSYRAQLAGWQFRFRSDVECPAELPTDMNGFLTQQHRWAKGSIQTGRKLTGRVLGAKLPLLTKLESLFHLFGNVAFPILLGLVLVAMPLHLLRFLEDSVVPRPLLWIEGTPLLLATLAVFGYYGLSQATLRRLSLASLMRLPLVIVLGAGASLNNTLAVFGALRRDPGEFRRTPKFAQQQAPRDRTTTYHSPRGLLPLFEVLIGAVAMTTFTLAALEGLWSSAAFHGLFAVGFLWVGARSWLANRNARALLPVALLASCGGGSSDGPPIIIKGQDPELLTCRSVIDDEFARTEIFYATHRGLGLDDLPNRRGLETGVRAHPDGNRVVFARERQKNQPRSRELYLDSIDHAVVDVRLTGNNAIDDGPDWSPDGKRIVFSSDRSGDRDLWVMDPDAPASATPLTSGPAVDRDPDWSTPGIVFSRADPGATNKRARIWFRDASGATLIPLTDGGTGTGDFEPAWSPDGRHVLFVRELAPGSQVLMQHTLGNPIPTMIGDGRGEDRYPRWSPTGDRILVGRNRPADGVHGLRLYAMHPDGKDPVMVFLHQDWSYHGFDALPGMKAYRALEPADVVANTGSGDLTMRLGRVSAGIRDYVDAKDGRTLDIRAQDFNGRKVAGVLLTLRLPAPVVEDLARVSIDVTAALTRADKDSFVRLAVRDFVRGRYDSAVEVAPADTGLHTYRFDFASLAHVDGSGHIRLEVIGDLSGSTAADLRIDHIGVKVRLHSPK